jgi:hypothetical protein
MVNLGLYQHHGISCGDGLVIHFGRGVFDLENAIVEKVDLGVFSQGRPVDVVQSKAVFEPAEIVSRAKGRLGESGYDLFENNCEHFVAWCRSGENESQQVNMSETVVRQSVAVAAKPLIRSWAVKTISRQSGLVAAGLARGPAIVAGVADAVQASVELVATKKGMTRAESRQIGRRVGFTSSAVLGWVVGGPVVSATGVGFWLVGQLIADRTVETGKCVLSEAMASTASRA